MLRPVDALMMALHRTRGISSPATVSELGRSDAIGRDQDASEAACELEVSSVAERMVSGLEESPFYPALPCLTLYSSLLSPACANRPRKVF